MTTACLSRGDEVLAESATRGRSTGAQRVLGDVHHLMRTVRVEPSDVEAIVVGTGPGTFTGLRIGLATARSLGFALRIPVRGVGTLDSLLQGDGVDVACVDARRGEVFATGAGVPLGAYAPEELVDLEPYLEDAVIFVEWPAAGRGILPPARARVELRHQGGDARLISLYSDDSALVEAVARSLS